MATITQLTRSKLVGRLLEWAIDKTLADEGPINLSHYFALGGSEVDKLRGRRNLLLAQRGVLVETVDESVEGDVSVETEEEDLFAGLDDYDLEEEDY